MEDYNFWADLLASYRASPDLIKALWLLIPPGFLLALIGMLVRLRIAGRRAGAAIEGELICSVRRGADGRFHIVSHAPQPRAERPKPPRIAGR